MARKCPVVEGYAKRKRIEDMKHFRKYVLTF